MHFSGKIFGKKHLSYFLKQTDERDGIMEHSKLNFVGEWMCEEMVYFWKQIQGNLETNTGMREGWNYGTGAASQFNFQPPLQTPLHPPPNNCKQQFIWEYIFVCFLTPLVHSGWIVWYGWKLLLVDGMLLEMDENR